MFKRSFNLLLLVSLLTSLLAFTPISHASAAALSVDTLVDENDHSCVDGDCSLRDAVEVAVSGDTIDFSVTGIITLSGQIDIAKDLTITGPGPVSLTISGGDTTRIFSIQSTKTVAITGLTLANGRPSPSSGSCGGGAIYNQGFLTLNDMVVTDNDVSLTDPGWCKYPRGGGISVWDYGSLTITNSQITNAGQKII